MASERVPAAIMGRAVCAEVVHASAAADTGGMGHGPQPHTQLAAKTARLRRAAFLPP